MNGLRKRKTASRDDEPPENSLQIGTSQLNLGGGESEDEQVGSGEEQSESDEDEDEDDFPEVDFDNSGDSLEEGSSEEEESDEERILRELEDEEENDEEDGSDLDELVRRHTSKPDESERTPGTSYEDVPTLDYMKKSQTVKSAITGEEKTEWPDAIEPDYDSDSSTEETTNRIGNVPAYWYDDMPHIGYDVDGKKVMRPATGDELDKFLEGVEDADGGWSVA